MLTARHWMRRRTALGRPPTPKVRIRRYAGLNLFNDILDPVLIPSDVAEANKHLICRLRHADNIITIGEYGVSIMPFSRERFVYTLAAYSGAGRYERVEISRIISAKAKKPEPCVPPKRGRVIAILASVGRIAAQHKRAWPRPPIT